MATRASRYDVVVVGAGTAGCAIASRLSEDGDTRVLLLEAGSADPLDLMAVPAAWPALRGTTADWGDQTVRQDATGTAMSWPRGRASGGSSSINAMNFVRGHRTSYDAWPEAGATGWGFDDLLPYFKRSEHVEGGAARIPHLGDAVPQILTSGWTASPATIGGPDAILFTASPDNETHGLVGKLTANN